MRLIYDNDARLFASDIVSLLHSYGFAEASEAVTRAIESIESELPVFPRIARELIREGGLMSAVRFFFFDTRMDAPTEFGLRLQQLLRKQIGRPAAREVEIAVEEAAAMAQQQDYECPTPLSVLAGLNVLFELIVVPRRHYQQANRRFQRILGAPLHIIDEDGELLLGPDQFRDERFDEDRFWNLLDTVTKLYRLSDTAEFDTGEINLRIAPEHLVLQHARLLGGSLIERMYRNRSDL